MFTLVRVTYMFTLVRVTYMFTLVRVYLNDHTVTDVTQITLAH